MKWLLAFLLFTSSAQATYRYVVPGGVGLGTGLTWVDAASSISTSANTTNYVGNGTISGFTVTASNVKVYKAVEWDHGTSTGWLSTYTNQCKCGLNAVSGDNFEMDGRYCNVQNLGSAAEFGFYATNSVTGSLSFDPKFWDLTGGPTNFIVRYMYHAGMNATNSVLTPGQLNADLGVYAFGIDWLMIDHCAFTDFGGPNIGKFGGCRFVTISNTIAARNFDSANLHGTAFADQGSLNVEIMNCIFEDIVGTGVLGALNRDSLTNICRNWKIVGTQFREVENSHWSDQGIGDGCIYFINNQYVTNLLVEYCTFANINHASAGSTTILWVGVGLTAGAYNDGIVFRNNLIWRCKNGVGLNLNRTTNEVIGWNECDGQIIGNYPFQTTNNVTTNTFVGFLSTPMNLNLKTNTGIGTNDGVYLLDPNGNTRVTPSKAFAEFTNNVVPNTNFTATSRTAILIPLKQL